MNSYTKRPLDVLNKDILKRKKWEIIIDFNYEPPPKGKYLKWHRTIRDELLSTIPFFTVLDDFELFTILQEIDKGKVPPYYKNIVEQFYNAKTNNNFVSKLVLGNGERFDVNEFWSYT